MSDQDVAVLIGLHGQGNEKVGHAEEEGHHAPEEQGVEGRQHIPLCIVAVAAAPAQKQAEQKLSLIHICKIVESSSGFSQNITILPKDCTNSAPL